MTRREAKFDAGTKLQFEPSTDSEIHYRTDAPRLLRLALVSSFKKNRNNKRQKVGALIRLKTGRYIKKIDPCRNRGRNQN
jgi:hypothetical protein